MQYNLYLNDKKHYIVTVNNFISSKAFAIDFKGKFRQGHFIIGKTEPKSKFG